MAEYIDQEALAADGWYLQRHIYREGTVYVENMNLLDVPTADVVPVVRGRWTDDSLCSPDGRWGLRGFKCSVCGGFCIGESNFCPNCGARMCNEEEQT